MANNHRYGFRPTTGENGVENAPPMRFPVSSAYQATTVVGAGTSVNLNTGDPVKLGEDGCIKLVQQDAGATGANADSDEFISHVIVGFERTLSSTGDVEQRSFQSNVTYTGGIGGDKAPIALCVPVAGKVFELDADAALANPTKSGALALVGKTCSIVYSVITSGVIGAPKANPLLDISVAEAAAPTDQNQVLIVGLGDAGDAMDFTAAGVTFKVKVSALAMAQMGDFAADNLAVQYGANVE
jgi:hypothetical protein